MLQANSLIAHYHNYLIQIVTYSENGIQIQHTVENIHNQTQDHIPVLQHNELISFSIKKKTKKQTLYAKKNMKNVDCLILLIKTKKKKNYKINSLK